MTDEEIRTIVREALARHLGPGSAAEAASPAQPLSTPPWRAHPSFGRFLLEPTPAQQGMCIVEPTVRCNHCGYCQSFGY